MSLMLIRLISIRHGPASRGMPSQERNAAERSSAHEPCAPALGTRAQGQALGGYVLEQHPPAMGSVQHRYSPLVQLCLEGTCIRRGHPAAQEQAPTVR